jgi:actin-like ATPase involved in cell morphogenesis
MAYYLGIDLGTTYTAAAIERGGTVEALTLGNRTASVPSVVFLRDDGEILVGEAATRRASSEPGRVAREFKRRVGDPTPIILGGTPYAAEMLMARMLRWALDKVQAQEGGPPQGIALTHPANWGPYKLDLLKQAVRQVDVDVELMLPEPVAAATFYASQRRLDPGAVVAVYDLGGGTFDAAMVRRTPSGFESVGSPEGIERLGGIDFDEAVFAHVRTAVGDALDQLDPEEPAAVAAVTRLRQECIDAKEALSGDTDVSIPVLLPNLQTEVRLTRSEFEDMIRPAINETIVALRRAIRSSNVSNDDISAVLLVGGSSRIPLVAQMVAAELGRPIAIDAHPKDAISFGAAIAVAERRGQATPESVKTVLPSDQRPPPPTMSDTGRPRPAPPRPAPPVGGIAAAGAAGAVGGAAAAAGMGAMGNDPRPAPPRPAPPGGPGAPGAPGAPGGPRPAPPQQPAPHAGPQTPTGSPTGPGGPSTAPGGPQTPTGSPSGPGQPGAPGQPGTYGGPTGPGGPGQQGPSGPPSYGAGGGPTGPGYGQQAPYGSSGGPAQQAGSPVGGFTPPGGGSGPGPAQQSSYGQPGQYGGGPASGPYQAPGTYGGTPASGGFPARPDGSGGGNRNLWIAIGGIVAAAAVIIGIIVVSSSGGDDDGGSTTTTTEQAGSSTTSDPGGGGGGGGGYNAAIEEEFVSSCATSADQAQCQCIYDELEADVPFDRFVEISQEVVGLTPEEMADPSNLPDELVTAVLSCMSTSTTGA